MGAVDVDFAIDAVFRDDFSVSVNQSARVSGQWELGNAAERHGAAQPYLNWLPGSGRPTLPVISFPRSCHIVAHPASVMPYTWSIFAFDEDPSKRL
jgi:hypothetical protein